MQPDLIAGDTLNFETTVPAYPPSASWVAKIRLVPRAGGSPIVITAASAGGGERYAFQVGPSVTATWPAGVYGWSLWVERAGERYTQESGQLTVRPDPAAMAGGIDTRSQAQKALEDARAALAAWTPTTRKYTIGGRQMEFNSVAEILQLISHWQVEVKREQAAERMAAGLDARRKVHVRIGRA
jgi:hypothetical protein